MFLSVICQKFCEKSPIFRWLTMHSLIVFYYKCWWGSLSPCDMNLLNQLKTIITFMSSKNMWPSISKAYLCYMFVPSKHIHPICQSCSLCLVVIDLTGKSRTGLLYLHGWEGWEASHQGDRWRPADGTPGNATFIIVILVAAHPLIMSNPPPLSLHFLFFQELASLIVFNSKWHLV